MAESAIQRLKRLAAERKALAGIKVEAVDALAPEVTETKAEEVKDAGSNIPVGDSNDNLVPDMGCDEGQGTDTSLEVNPASSPAAVESVSNSVPAISEPDSPTILTEPVTLTKSSRNHPLVREMEELEASLEQNVPGFVTILRDIHKKLAADPLTVTLLSREERGTIVKGMTRHANITIATKAVSKTSRSKKVAVSVSDL